MWRSSGGNVHVVMDTSNQWDTSMVMLIEPTGHIQWSGHIQQDSMDTWIILFRNPVSSILIWKPGFRETHYGSEVMPSCCQLRQISLGGFFSVRLGKISLDSCYGTLREQTSSCSFPALICSDFSAQWAYMCLVIESLCQRAKRKSMEVLLTLKHPAASSFCACRSLQVSAVVSACLGSSAAAQQQRENNRALRRQHPGTLILEGKPNLCAEALIFSVSQQYEHLQP